MFAVYEIRDDNHIQILKSGFKTYTKANQWATKNLPLDQLKLFGAIGPFNYKYYVGRR